MPHANARKILDCPTQEIPELIWSTSEAGSTRNKELVQAAAFRLTTELIAEMERVVAATQCAERTVKAAAEQGERTAEKNLRLGKRLVGLTIGLKFLTAVMLCLTAVMLWRSW